MLEVDGGGDVVGVGVLTGVVAAVDVDVVDLVGAAVVLGGALVPVGVRALTVGTLVRAAVVLRVEWIAALLGVSLVELGAAEPRF